jgi:hypothetical protein
MPDAAINWAAVELLLPRDGEMTVFKGYANQEEAIGSLSVLCDQAVKSKSSVRAHHPSISKPAIRCVPTPPLNVQMQMQHPGARDHPRRTDDAVLADIASHVNTNATTIVDNLKATGAFESLIPTATELVTSSKAVLESMQNGKENTVMYHSDQPLKPKEAMAHLEKLVHPSLIRGGMQRFAADADVWQFHTQTEEFQKKPELGRPQGKAALPSAHSHR